VHDRKLIHLIGDHQLEGLLQIGFGAQRFERHACHHLAYGRRPPRVMCQVLGVGDAHHAGQSPHLDDRQCAVAAA